MKMAYYVNAKESVVLITDAGEDGSLEIRGGDVVDADSIAGLNESRQWKKFINLGIMKEITEGQKDKLSNVTDNKEASESKEDSATDHEDAIMIDLTEELKDLHGHEGEATNATVAEADEGVSKPNEVEMEKIADGTPDHSHSPRDNVRSSDVTPTEATNANVGDDQVGGKTRAEKAELRRPAEETEQIFVELEEIKDNSH
jgi:hypothetical protein